MKLQSTPTVPDVVKRTRITIVVTIDHSEHGDPDQIVDSMLDAGVLQDDLDDRFNDADEYGIVTGAYVTAVEEIETDDAPRKAVKP